MYTVSELAKLSGVSVRTLHYYDQIELLHPAQVTVAGYRLYSEENLAQLQQILFLRELDFSLSDIGAILRSPGYDRREALAGQRRLLQLKAARLDRLIALIDNTLKEEQPVSFEAFEASDIEAARAAYAEEARARYGGSRAFTESERRTSAYTGDDWRAIAAEADDIYAQFAAAMREGPAGSAAQAAVARWQQHITEHYYECTDDILSGLGELYAADERFAKSIDSHAPGLARFMSAAIAIHCAK